MEPEKRINNKDQARPSQRHEEERSIRAPEVGKRRRTAGPLGKHRNACSDPIDTAAVWSHERMNSATCNDFAKKFRSCSLVTLPDLRSLPQNLRKPTYDDHHDDRPALVGLTMTEALKPQSGAKGCCDVKRSEGALDRSPQARTTSPRVSEGRGLSGVSQGQSTGGTEGCRIAVIRVTTRSSSPTRCCLLTATGI